MHTLNPAAANLKFGKDHIHKSKSDYSHQAKKNAA
jgi:hypothetical protein